MVIDDLLSFWAGWSARKEKNRLGYRKSQANKMMAGGAFNPCTDFRPNPAHAVAEDEAVAVIDRAVCRLTPRRRMLVIAEYRMAGTQAAKAAGLKPPCNRQNYERLLRNARMNLMADEGIRRLLKKC